MKEIKHVVSFSGGKDSTAVVLRMLELGMPIDIVLYCDTGLEFPEMEKHVKTIEDYVSSRGVKFVTLKSEKDFEYYLLCHKPNRKAPVGYDGYQWPFSRARWCTTRLKQEPIRRFLSDLKSSYDIVEYDGIAADEQYRLARDCNKLRVHPLVNWGWDEKDALLYCYQNGYTWGGLYEKFRRVSCWCCPLQPLSELRTLYKDFPHLWSILEKWDDGTVTTFKGGLTVHQLAMRFDLELERIEKGLSIHPNSKDFRDALRIKLKNV